MAQKFGPELQVRVLPGCPMVETGPEMRLHVATAIIGPQVPLSDRLPIRLMIVLDVSGSMSEKAGEDGRTSKLALAKRVFHRFVRFLQPDDQVGLVAFSTTATLLSSPARMTADAKRHLAGIIDRLSVESNTNISDGVITAARAAQAMRKNPSDPLSLLLITDGNANEGVANREAFVRLLENDWATGVRIFSAGIGQNYRPDLLHRLSEVSSGHFAHVTGEADFDQAMGDLLGSVISVEHTNLSVSIRPQPGTTFAGFIESGRVVEEAGERRILLGDLIAESMRTAAGALEFAPGRTPSVDPEHVADVVVRGLNARTGREWEDVRPVMVRFTAPGAEPIVPDHDAYSVICVLAARAAAVEAHRRAEAGEFREAVAVIDRAMAFITSWRAAAGVDATESFALLTETRRVVDQADHFRAGHHASLGRTTMFGTLGGSAPHSRTTAIRTMTTVIGERDPDDEQGA